MPKLQCDGCRETIRRGARSKCAKCPTGHLSHLHRRCLKPSSRCRSCAAPFAVLVGSDGTESERQLKAMRTKVRNEALARALWSEFEAGRAGAEVPKYINWRHMTAIKKRLRSFNVRGDKWQDAPDRHDGAKLEAFLDSIVRA